MNITRLPKPFIENQSRRNSPIALLQYSERGEFPRSFQTSTEFSDKEGSINGATGITYHECANDPCSSPIPISDHFNSEFSTESGETTYTVSRKGLKCKALPQGGSEMPQFSDQYTSSELAVEMPKQDLIEITKKKCSTHRFKRDIRDKNKRIGEAHLYIRSKVRQTDGKDKAMLQATIKLNRHLMKKIKERDEICSVSVDAHVMHGDQRLNKSIHPHLIDIKDSTVTFEQELVSCDELADSAIKTVVLKAKVILTIKPRVKISYCTEDELV